MMEVLAQPDTLRTLDQFGGPKCRVGTKPLLSFSGPQFADESPTSNFALAKSLFMDFFRGEDASALDVEGLQLLITFTAAEIEIEGAGSKEMVYMRVWRIVTKKSGQKLPRVELEEMGPRIDFRIGRTQFAEEGILKEALKKGKTSEVCAIAHVILLLTNCSSLEIRRILRQIWLVIRLDVFILANKIYHSYKREK
jgi:ribosome production factor 2